MDIPANWEQILNDFAALERENARLRQLLDDIHRRKTDLTPVPPRYDERIAGRETGSKLRRLAHGLPID